MGIAQRSDGDIEVILKTGSTLSVQSFDTNTGLTVGKTSTLKSGSVDVVHREYFYNIDLNNDGIITFVGTPPGWG